MRVVVSGATGLVGQALRTQLEKAGHETIPLVRSGSSSNQTGIPWDPENGVLAADALSGMDAVVHLAGENIASGRWNEERKARIRDSRVKGTTLLAERIAVAASPPPVLVSASALGYYGDRGDEVVTEASASGEGFLAEVCREWEAATAPAAVAGVRVVNIRIGIVLSPDGGALAKMLTPFKLGLGGPLGDGSMWMSWIHLDDLARAIVFAINSSELSGPLNAFAPNPVRNKEFTKALGHVLKRPTVLPAPEFALKAALGEMADALLLSSLRGKPERLQETGFDFLHPELEPALRDLLDS